jgi:hypothetical protein
MRIKYDNDVRSSSSESSSESTDISESEEEAEELEKRGVPINEKKYELEEVKEQICEKIDDNRSRNEYKSSYEQFNNYNYNNNNKHENDSDINNDMDIDDNTSLKSEDEYINSPNDINEKAKALSLNNEDINLKKDISPSILTSDGNY